MNPRIRAFPPSIYCGRDINPVESKNIIFYGYLLFSFFLSGIHTAKYQNREGYVIETWVQMFKTNDVVS